MTSFLDVAMDGMAFPSEQAVSVFHVSVTLMGALVMNVMKKQDSVTAALE